MTDTVESISLQEAAKGIGVHPLTIRRWIKRGWLAWEKPYTKQPQSLAKLLALKHEILARKNEAASKRAKAKQKYFTDDERATAAYLAVKKYRAANKDFCNHTDSARKTLHRHPYFLEMKEELMEFYGPLCLACQRRNWNTLDHVVPLPLGENHPCNLQPLCRQCNTRKRCEHTDYRPDKGRWLAIRWGGWKINGHVPGQRRIATGPKRLAPVVWNPDTHAATTERMESKRRTAWKKGESGSLHEEWRSVHEKAIIDHRLRRVHAGSLLSVDRYKSFGIKGPTIHTDGITDMQHTKLLMGL